MRIKVKPFFAWYDFWIGAYWDRKQSTLYFCPIPMVGLMFYFYKPVDNTDLNTLLKKLIKKKK